MINHDEFTAEKMQIERTAITRKMIVAGQNVMIGYREEPFSEECLAKLFAAMEDERQRGLN